MINWLNIILNLPWIIGMAIILITFSYADWFATQQQARMGSILHSILHQTSLSVGFILICLSLVLQANIEWQRWVWISFMAIFCLLLVFSTRAEGT